MNSPLRNTLRRRAALGAIGGAILVAAGAGYFTGPAPVSAAEGAVIIPAPALDQTNPSDGLETAIFAGGCFWGVQGVFQHVIGVDSAVSGYAGGTTVDPSYKDVLTETTGHAESVQVTFDPKQVTYGKLLQIFFSVAHDPTQLNRQGPDVGTQYRSAIFTLSAEQKRVADAYIDQLGATGAYNGAIVTEVTPLDAFYRAEDYHQDYATLHPNSRYIATFDAPKIANLKRLMPEVYRDKPVLVGSAARR